MLSEGSLKWLENHCISQETAEHFNLDTEERHFPELQCNRRAIRIPYVVNGTDIGSRWVDSKENWTGDLPSQQLWNIDGRKPPTIFICDNELAVMALHGVGIHAICPSDYTNPKAMADIPYLHDVLSGFPDVCLLLSKTQESVAWERELSKVFVKQKAYTTRFQDDCVTVLDVIKKHGKNGVDDCVEKKHALPLHGVHSFSEFWGEIKDYAKGNKFKSYSTGWGNLDKIFTMQPGSVNVIGGIPSAGKSEVVDQLIVNMVQNHGWRWLVYSPESYPACCHWGKLAEKITGKPLWGTNHMEYDDMVKAMEIIQPNIKLILPDEEEKTVDDVLDAARLSLIRFGIKGLLIDPFNSMDHIMRSGENEHQYIGRFLSTIRNFARIHNLWIGVVCHPVKMTKNETTGEYNIPTSYSLAGSSNWFNKADNILCVYRKIIVPDGTVSVFTQKIKNKFVGRTGEARFTWDRSSGRFTPIEEMGEYLDDD